MKYLKMYLLIILVASAFILIPSFALISSSQSNETLSDDTPANETFSGYSRELAENQSDSNGESGDDDE
jgi:hypothetical protein